MFSPLRYTSYVVFNTFAVYVVSVVKLKYLYDVCVVNVVKVISVTVTLSPKESSPCSYNLHRTEAFVKSFRKLDSNVQKVLDKTIRDVLPVAPFETKKLVSPELKGKRSLRRGNFRVLFAICRECRELGSVRLNNCIDCRNRGENDIMLFVCGHRKHVYNE
jgi:mRNA-degrading endonuclease RelE of RelBE toxin-antitoxin system